jgi:hypothetical protein
VFGDANFRKAKTTLAVGMRENRSISLFAKISF